MINQQIIKYFHILFQFYVTSTSKSLRTHLNALDPRPRAMETESPMVAPRDQSLKLCCQTRLCYLLAL